MNEKIPRPWQCYLSERDWAVIAMAWDNSEPLAEAAKSFATWEKEAEAGHFGNCTKQAENCFKCDVDSYYRLGEEMREAWDRRRSVTK